MLALGIVLAGGFVIWNNTISLHYNRLLLLQSERWSLVGTYLDAVSQRPIFGLAGTRGLSAEKDIYQTTYAHDAYLTLLYMGGLSYFLPLFSLLLYSLWCSFKVWRARRLSGYDPILISTLIFMLFAMYLHGISDVQLYFPVYIWAWLHIFVAGFMMSVSPELQTRAQATLAAEYGFENGEAWPEESHLQLQS